MAKLILRAAMKPSKRSNHGGYGYVKEYHVSA